MTTSLKTVFEISEIAKTLEILRTDAESQKAYYNDFVACMNGQIPPGCTASHLIGLSDFTVLPSYPSQLLNDLEGEETMSNTATLILPQPQTQ